MPEPAIPIWNPIEDRSPVPFSFLADEYSESQDLITELYSKYGTQGSAVRIEVQGTNMGGSRLR